METEILYARLLFCPVEGVLEAREPPPLSVRENMVPVSWDFRQDGPNGLIHGDVPPLRILRVRQGDDPLLKIHLIPSEAKDFPFPHPGV